MPICGRDGTRLKLLKSGLSFNDGRIHAKDERSYADLYVCSVCEASILEIGNNNYFVDDPDQQPDASIITKEVRYSQEIVERASKLGIRLPQIVLFVKAEHTWDHHTGRCSCGWPWPFESLLHKEK
jgi:hypothetical protein